MNLLSLTAAAAQMAEDQMQSRYAGLYTDALNLAQQQFVLDTKCLWKYQTGVCVSGQAAYPLPTDFLFEKECSLNGLPLGAASKSDLTRMNSGTRWDVQKGTPTNYCVDPEANTKDLILYPIPQNGDSGKDIILTYYSYPVDLLNPTDIPLNGNALLAQFHMGIAAWAAWYLKQAESVTPEIAAKKRDLRQIYNDMVSQCVDTFKDTVSDPLRMRGVRVY